MSKPEHYHTWWNKGRCIILVARDAEWWCCCGWCCCTWLSRSQTTRLGDWINRISFWQWRVSLFDTLLYINICFTTDQLCTFILVHSKDAQRALTSTKPGTYAYFAFTCVIIRTLHSAPKSGKLHVVLLTTVDHT